jgi:lysophospholipase L1-like esterase
LILGFVHAINVACIGDEFTLQYTPYLAQALGDRFNVTSFAVESATVLRNGDFPIWNSTVLNEFMHSLPDVVVIMFGTNDAKAQNWDVHRGEFGANYRELIQKVVVLRSNPQIHLVIPPPLYKDGMCNIHQDVVNGQLPQLISMISRDTDLNEVIDAFNSLGGIKMSRPDLMKNDGVHANDAGNKMIADTVVAKIKEDYELPNLKASMQM